MIVWPVSDYKVQRQRLRRRKNNNHRIPLWAKDWSISSSGQHGASIITLGTLIICITKITVILFKVKPIIFGYFYSLILPVFNWTCLQGPSPNMGLRPWLMTPVPPEPQPPSQKKKIRPLITSFGDYKIT